MSEKTCSSCAYYLQHYAFDHRKIFRVCCGHCTHLRAKMKRPDETVCEHYRQGASVESAFVTKEYLSKALIEYVLKLDLLPEIHDMEETAKNGSQ